jgi:hypothetical protein
MAVIYFIRSGLEGALELLAVIQIDDEINLNCLDVVNLMSLSEKIYNFVSLCDKLHMDKKYHICTYIHVYILMYMDIF